MSKLKNQRLSIDALIGSLVSRLRSYGFCLFVSLSLFYSALVLQESHKAVCSVVQAKLDSFAGPLARELTLGEVNTSNAIFAKLKQDIVQLGVSANLKLTPKNETLGADKNVQCQAYILKTNIQYPLHFGGVNLGSISGSITYFSITQWGLTLALIFLIFTISLKIVGLQLTKKLKSMVIDPIRLLSEDKILSPDVNFPVEVLEIQENILQLKAKILEKERLNFSLIKTQELTHLAEQVSHDIRSPLAALGVVEQDLEGLSEEKRILIRSAIRRIRDIANNLLESNRATARQEKAAVTQELFSIELIPVFIDSMISEKRLQFKSKPEIEIESVCHSNFLSNFSPNFYGIFAKIQPTEFKRVLSNLINNSVEALNKQGRIEVNLSAKAHELVIRIRDSGRGIPSDILPRLMQRGETYGKKEGTGLGLFHAKTTLESWGGGIEISSHPPEGTTVTLRLPQAEPPPWFVSSIVIKPESSIAILDDDPSIHQVWKSRFRPLELSNRHITVNHFSTPNELEKWLTTNPIIWDQTLYLIDYELIGQSLTGLDIIHRQGIQNQSILVTSRFDDPAIRERAEKLGVRLIPKGLAPYVPISVDSRLNQLSPL